MAEDKKIRISADLSQLRSLREEATGLVRELNDLSNSGGNDEAISKLKEQLVLLGERNDLEELYNELQKRGSQFSNQHPDIIPARPASEPSPPIEREVVKQELPKLIEPRQLPKPIPFFTAEELAEKQEEDLADTEERKKDDSGWMEPAPVKKLRKKAKSLFDRVNENLSDDFDEPFLDEDAEEKETSIVTQERKPKIIPRERKPRKSGNPNLGIFEEDAIVEEDPEEVPEEKVSRPKKPKKTKKSSESSRTSPQSEEEGIEPMPKEPKEVRGGGADILAFLERWQSSLAETDDVRNKSLEDLISLVSDIKDKQSEGASGGGGGDTPIIDSATGEGGKPKKKGDKKDKDPDVGPGAKAMVGAWLATKGIQAAFDKVAEVVDMVKERHIRTLAMSQSREYLDPISAVTEYTSYKGKQKADNYSWIPFVGDTAAREITTIADAKAQHQGIGLRAASQLEQQVRPYSQTFGVSNGRAIGDAFREGSYAASALGLDVGEYSTKRAGLVRAGGGKEDVSGVRESQSLMAVERLYGLQPQSTSALQGTMRFSEKDTNSTNSSSSVIRLFEQTMRDLKKPFSEIASTIEESLNTFNKTADSILSKAGDFDASKVAGMLAGIRAYTGAEGKQLERYQESFSGQVISQDEVTQALLLRTVTKMDSSVKTYSDAMAKIDKIQEDPALMKDFLKSLQGLTTTNEQFINVLKAVFPKLSFTDIKDVVEKPGFNIDLLFAKVMEATKKAQKENDKKSQYEKNAAAKTVGTLESFDKNYQNSMKGFGVSISGDIKAILEEMKRLKGGTPVKDGIDTAADIAADALLKISSKMIGLNDKGQQTRPGFFEFQGAALGTIALLVKQFLKDKD